MGCEVIRDPDGDFRAILCGGRRRTQPRKCVGCGEMTATQECDAYNERKKSNTCDAAICPRCSVELPGLNLDVCPKHRHAATPVGGCTIDATYRSLRAGWFGPDLHPPQSCDGALLWPQMICVEHLLLFSRWLREAGGWRDVYSKSEGEIPREEKRRRFLIWMHEFFTGEVSR